MRGKYLKDVNMAYVPTMPTSLGNTSGTPFNGWSTPERIRIIENLDSIEFIYKQTSMIRLAIYPSPPPEERVFKIIFSCKDGVWNKSEPIYGKIVPAQEETYKF